MDNQTRLLALKGGKSWRDLAEELELSNVSYVYDYVVYGVIPGSRAVRDALGIDAGVSYTRNRRNRLNKIAVDAGYKSWSAFETDILREHESLTEELKVINE